MSDFWERKLGGQPQQQPRGIVLQPQQPQYQQPQPVQQQMVQVPPGYQLVPIQPGQPQQQHQMVQQQPQDVGKMLYSQVAREHDGEKISGLWKGGEGMRKEGNLKCPNCYSTTGYTEYSGTIMNGSRPRPHCYECGYNGYFQQADQANWTTV